MLQLYKKLMNKAMPRLVFMLKSNLVSVSLAIRLRGLALRVYGGLGALFAVCFRFFVCSGFLAFLRFRVCLGVFVHIHHRCLYLTLLNL